METNTQTLEAKHRAILETYQKDLKLGQNDWVHRDLTYEGN